MDKFHQMFGTNVGAKDGVKEKTEVACRPAKAGPVPERQPRPGYSFKTKMQQMEDYPGYKQVPIVTNHKISDHDELDEYDRLLLQSESGQGQEMSQQQINSSSHQPAK